MSVRLYGAFGSYRQNHIGTSLFSYRWLLLECIIVTGV